MTYGSRPTSLLILPLALLLACSGPDEPEGADAAQLDATPEPDAKPLSQSCMDAADHSDILWLQDNVFNSCAAFSVCHQGAAASAGGLNLESGFTETSMIGIDSTLFTDWKLVVPGDQANSYLMVILGDQEGPLKDGVGTMPYNSPLLCQPKIDAIGRWIDNLP